jgi:phosphatidylglycerophosphatase A
MKFGEKTVLFLATVAFIGYIPLAPGTLGSLFGLLIYWFLSKISLTIAIIITLMLIGLAIWIAHSAEKIVHKKDPGCIVIDEVAGQVVALIGLPADWIWLAAGFVVFRCFDILKPFPIRTVERRFSGGAGVVMDDVVAGILSNLVLRLIFYLKDLI